VEKFHNRRSAFDASMVDQVLVPPWTGGAAATAEITGEGDCQ